MSDLTTRQQEILRAVIEEYIGSADPVGSETIVEKYNLDVSPATVRNEMVELTEIGYLKQPHTSAGRVPTPIAMKFYINTLMKESQMSVRDEVAIKEELWDRRFEFDRLMRLSARRLAESTGVLAVAVNEDGDVYAAGAASILDMPEFYDIDLTKTVLTMLDTENMLHQILARAVGEDPVHVLLGEELGMEYLEPCGFVFAHFGAGKKHSGSIGVIGPARMRYSRVIPTVRYFSNLLGEMADSW
jgi:transcriptional regulator of heat shock response